MYNRILITLDGSELAERAVSHALEIAHKFESEIVLLRVPVVEAQMAVAYGIAVPYEADIKRSQEEAEGYLYSWKMKLLGSGVNVRTEVVSGAPADVILDVADADRADLVVMSTHGRSGLSRLMYGSVAESVLRGSKIPILLIPVK
jgi:nucleotide-binding universal stress UspA family protein